MATERKSIEQRACECIREIRECDSFYLAVGKADPRTQSEKDEDAAREVAVAIRKALLSDRRTRKAVR